MVIQSPKFAEAATVVMCPLSGHHGHHFARNYRLLKKLLPEVLSKDCYPRADLIFFQKRSELKKRSKYEPLGELDRVNAHTLREYLKAYFGLE